VKSGKEERYLKDEHELKQHQLRRALNGATIQPGAGNPPLAGEALERIASEYLTTEAVIDRLSQAMDSAVLHSMLGMQRISLADKDGAAEAARAFHVALAPKAPKTHIERDPTSDGWRLRLEKFVHGNKVETVIDHAFLESGDYAQIVATARTLSGLIREDALVKRGETTRSIRTFREGLEWLLAEAKGSMAIQRYKGLGEMNPEQLWETTMDPTKRILLKVEIVEEKSTGERVESLMGNRPEERFRFIQENAEFAKVDLDI
jgi:DNA gyrase subunit B